MALSSRCQVCGITGTFSKSCEVSMEVLRDNRESVMAVLEAFVYDPLIAWRLNAAHQPGGRVTNEQEMDEGYARQRKSKINETEVLNGEFHKHYSGQAEPCAEAERPEVKNEKGLAVIDRVRKKLTGRDYKTPLPLSVKEQVERLVDDATKTENLCVAYIGW